MRIRVNKCIRERKESKVLFFRAGLLYPGKVQRTDQNGPIIPDTKPLHVTYKGKCLHLHNDEVWESSHIEAA
jgi:hypothetical protein